MTALFEKTVYVLHSPIGDTEKTKEFYNNSGYDVMYSDMRHPLEMVQLVYHLINIMHCDLVAFPKDWYRDGMLIAVYFACKQAKIKMVRLGTLEPLRESIACEVVRAQIE